MKYKVIRAICVKVHFLAIFICHIWRSKFINLISKSVITIFKSTIITNLRKSPIHSWVLYTVIWFIKIPNICGKSCLQSRICKCYRSISPYENSNSSCPTGRSCVSSIIGCNISCNNYGISTIPPIAFYP